MTGKKPKHGAIFTAEEFKDDTSRGEIKAQALFVCLVCALFIFLFFYFVFLVVV